MSGTSPKICPALRSAKTALDAVDELDDLECPGNHGKQRRFFAFVDGIFAGVQMDVGRNAGEVRQGRLRQGRKQRDGGEFI